MNYCLLFQRKKKCKKRPCVSVSLSSSLKIAIPQRVKKRYMKGAAMVAFLLFYGLNNLTSVSAIALRIKMGFFSVLVCVSL